MSGGANAGSFDIRKRATELPASPGVYCFLDGKGRILYIGKARNLKKRVGSYCRPHSYQIPAMLSRAVQIDYTVTRTEREALILESSMVRHHKPRYNVLLRDDKRFPYLKFTKERYPRLLFVRRTADDGARYFGPFTSGPVSRTLRFVRRLFGLRPCTRMLPGGCIYGDIDACLAPCRGRVTDEEYNAAVRLAAGYLGGEHRALMAEMEQQMAKHSSAQEYEKAAAIRDQLRAITRIHSSQRVDFLDGSDRDAIVVKKTGDDGALVLHYSIRGGVLAAKKNFTLSAGHSSGPGEILGAFIGQYYGNAGPPPEIILPTDIPDRPVFEDWLSSVAGSKVTLCIPKIGPRQKLLELMETNLGNLAFSLKGTASPDYGEAAAGLAMVLRLRSPPRTIEAFDISTVQGAHSVGSKVRFEGGMPTKSGYRRFRIRTVTGQDDFAMMGEVVSRRLAHAGDDPLPDLLVIDGGAGQLAAAVGALRNAGLKLPVAALAKKEEELYIPGRSGPVAFPENSRARHLLIRLRDESHRFALGYHRKLRGRAQTASALDRVAGLGKNRAIALLRRFSSVRGIRAASEDELCTVTGIGPVLAQKIKDALS